MSQPPASTATTFEAFEALFEAGQGAVAWMTEPADLETPVAAYLKLAHGKANSFLLESVEGGAARGRYSIIGMEPDLIWRCKHGRAEINRHARTNPDAFEPARDPPLTSLRRLIDDSRLTLPPALPPMCGGLVGYMGYDMARQMEALPEQGTDPFDLSDAILIRPSLFAVFDNVRDELFLVAPVFRSAASTAKAAWQIAQSGIARLRAALACSLIPEPPTRAQTNITPIEPISNIEKGHFLSIITRMKEYIAAGDVFQVVPSQRFSAPFKLPAFALYRALRRINPAPFLFHLQFAGFALVGSSPEILVRLRDGIITLRPLAGTRPRGMTRDQDLALEQDLLADPKERAEHLMLLDLGRNDVGRVAEPGSVTVTESFVVERFSHVMHISSNVEGRIRPGLSALDALTAGFPAGTLTGAPKVRAMQIINELEPDRRGTYAGCIGYFAPDGTMDTCIGLRTALVKDGMMHVQAGCGVVADSIPEMEYEETRQKARALFRAAEEALRFTVSDSAD